jgi:hypothetical protein
MQDIPILPAAQRGSAAGDNTAIPLNAAGHRQVTRFFPALSTHACRVTASCRLGVSHATSSALEAVVAVHGYLAPQVLFASVGRQGSTVVSTCVSAGAVKG